MDVPRQFQARRIVILDHLESRHAPCCNYRPRSIQARTVFVMMGGCGGTCRVDSRMRRGQACGLTSRVHNFTPSDTAWTKYTPTELRFGQQKLTWSRRFAP